MGEIKENIEVGLDVLCMSLPPIQDNLGFWESIVSKLGYAAFFFFPFKKGGDTGSLEK